MLKPGASCETPHCSLVSILVNTKNPKKNIHTGFYHEHLNNALSWLDENI